jgi:hypothetical protein
MLNIDHVVEAIAKLDTLSPLPSMPIGDPMAIGRLALITALSFALGSTAFTVIWDIAFNRRFGFEGRKILKGTSKNRRFPPPRKSDSKFSYSERERLAWDSLASSI